MTKTAATCPVAVSPGEVNNGSSDPDGDTLAYSLSPAGPFSPGTTNVTLTATDPSGSSSSCSATVTVVDNTPPTISCPTGTTASANSSCQAAVPDLLAGVTATDGCTASGSLIKTQSPAAGTLVGLGVTTITVTVKDAANNTSTCTTTFTVQDTTPPVVPNLPGSPQTFTWLNVNTPGAKPSTRGGHRMVYDPVRHKVILFGGADSSGYRNDVWELDTASNTWTEVTPTSGAMPIPRGYFGMAYDISRNKVVVYGGQVSSQYSNVGITGDTWEWDPAAHTWTQKPASTLVYVGLSGAAMAYDPNRHQVILFGGRAYWSFGEVNTYAWDGTNWTDITPAVYPDGRSYHSMATDLGRSKVVMFGGYNGNPLQDTWEWNGSSWTQVALSGPVPGRRAEPAMAYDSSRQVTTIFGGNVGGVSNSETWDWDGTSWKLLQPATSPSSRSTNMVYDSAQSKLVLFSGGGQADTWYSQTTSGLPIITGECSASVTAPIATDNCAGPITGTTADPTTYNAQGTYTVHWTYNDGNGNSSTQNQTVIVKDTTSPTITAPPNVSATTGAGATSCGVVISDATLGTATAGDNCSNVTPIRSGVPTGNIFPVGTTTLTYAATDGAGHTTSATQTVTVTDNTAPNLSCPAPISVSAGSSCQAAIPNVVPNVTASDNCTASGSIIVTQSPAAGTMVALGPHTITVTAKDGANNTSTCTTTFTVQDTTSPVIPNLPGSPQTFNWVQVNTPGSTPGPRTGHRMVYDPVRHKVILFGGHDPAVHPSGNYVLTSHLNDIWELDTATNVWTNVTPTTGAMPVGRADFGMAYDVARDKVVIFGGEIDGWLAGDTWEWDPATRTWAEKPASSLVYGGLFGAAMAYDPNRHQVILFGGRAYYNWGEGGTWAWDGTNWNNITPSVYPPPRFIHAMATDLARSKVVMFGGKNNAYALTDTWEWDGNAWTQVALSGAVPPARDDPAMAYDATRQVTVLFGGFEANDTWSWNGAGMVIRSSSNQPFTALHCNRL